jgi:oligosaccharide repeat unit polymerase
MTFVLIILAVFISILLGRHLFRSLFNPITVYAVIWGTELFLYELKLIRYFDLSSQTWLIIGCAYACFLMGILLVFAGRQLGQDSHASDVSFRPSHILYAKIWPLGLLITVPALIGFAGAVQHWLVLLKMFGSMANILINAPTIYSMRVEGEIRGFVPYLTTFSYIAVFFSGVFTGKKENWHPCTLLAFLGVILEDLAHVGRTGMLFAFFEFITTWILTLMIQTQKSLLRKKIALHVLGLVLMLVLLANMVKSARIVTEEFESASRSLSKINRTSLISPSIYLYFSSQMGVLNKYLAQQNESAVWGENTFLPAYNLLAKAGIIHKPRFYQKGYFVPMWSNTGTYLKELHLDFGYAGIFIGPLLLGFGLTFFWFRFFQTQRLTDLVVLVYLFLILHFSFLMLIPRLGIWWIGFTVLFALTRLIEHRAAARQS